MQEKISEFIKTLQYEYGYSAQTLRAYRSELRLLFKFLQEKQTVTDVSAFNQKLLREYLLSRRAGGSSTATLARTIATLKSYGNWLLQRQYIQTNPALKLKAPKSALDLPKVINENKMTAVLEAIAQKTKTSDRPEDLRDHAIAELLYASGVRIGELCARYLADKSR